MTIAAELPGIGLLAIQTRWTVTGFKNGVATATPVGPPSGTPQVGYSAMISTMAQVVIVPPAIATVPEVVPQTSTDLNTQHSVTDGVGDCDRLAAHPLDTDAITTGVDYPDLDEQAVIAACHAALIAAPDTKRFYPQLARGYFKAGMYAEAYQTSLDGADRGSAQAMAYLGVMYKNGTHVQQDAAQSLIWFERAAHYGNIGGMVFTAGLYLNSPEITPNPERAAKWYKTAIELGNGEAMANLGLLYNAGRGVTRDSKQAAQLLLKALSMNTNIARDFLIGNPTALSVRTRKEVQNLLREQGFYSGAIDGKFGPTTKGALEAYSQQ